MLSESAQALPSTTTASSASSDSLPVTTFELPANLNIAENNKLLENNPNLEQIKAGLNQIAAVFKQISDAAFEKGRNSYSNKYEPILISQAIFSALVQSGENAPEFTQGILSAIQGIRYQHYFEAKYLLSSLEPFLALLLRAGKEAPGVATVFCAFKMYRSNIEQYLEAILANSKNAVPIATGLNNLAGSSSSFQYTPGYVLPLIAAGEYAPELGAGLSHLLSERIPVTLGILALMNEVAKLGKTWDTSYALRLLFKAAPDSNKTLWINDKFYLDLLFKAGSSVTSIAYGVIALDKTGLLLSKNCEALLALALKDKKSCDQMSNELLLPLIGIKQDLLLPQFLFEMLIKAGHLGAGTMQEIARLTQLFIQKTPKLAPQLQNTIERLLSAEHTPNLATIRRAFEALLKESPELATPEFFEMLVQAGPYAELIAQSMIALFKASPKDLALLSPQNCAALLKLKALEVQVGPSKENDYQGRKYSAAQFLAWQLAALLKVDPALVQMPGVFAEHLRVITAGQDPRETTRNFIDLFKIHPSLATVENNACLIKADSSERARVLAELQALYAADPEHLRLLTPQNIAAVKERSIASGLVALFKAGIVISDEHRAALTKASPKAYAALLAGFNALLNTHPSLATEENFYHLAQAGEEAGALSAGFIALYAASPSDMAFIIPGNRKALVEACAQAGRCAQIVDCFKTVLKLKQDHKTTQSNFESIVRAKQPQLLNDALSQLFEEAPPLATQVYFQTIVAADEHAVPFATGLVALFQKDPALLTAENIQGLLLAKEHAPTVAAAFITLFNIDANLNQLTPANRAILVQAGGAAFRAATDFMGLRAINPALMIPGNLQKLASYDGDMLASLRLLLRAGGTALASQPNFDRIANAAIKSIDQLIGLLAQATPNLVNQANLERLCALSHESFYPIGDSLLALTQALRTQTVFNSLVALCQDENRGLCRHVAEMFILLFRAHQDTRLLTDKNCQLVMQAAIRAKDGLFLGDSYKQVTRGLILLSKADPALLTDINRARLLESSEEAENENDEEVEDEGSKNAEDIAKEIIKEAAAEKARIAAEHARIAAEHARIAAEHLRVETAKRAEEAKKQEAARIRRVAIDRSKNPSLVPTVLALVLSVCVAFLVGVGLLAAAAIVAVSMIVTWVASAYIAKRRAGKMQSVATPVESTGLEADGYKDGEAAAQETLGAWSALVFSYLRKPNESYNASWHRGYDAQLCRNEVAREEARRSSPQL